MQPECTNNDDTLFFQAFKYATIGMALVAPDGRWLKVNPSLCDLLGYEEEYLLLNSFQDITFPEDLVADEYNMLQTLEGNIDAYKMEKRYIHKSGKIVWALLSVSLVRDQSKQPAFFISQIQDISGQKEAHIRLRGTIDEIDRLRHQQKQILDAAAEGILGLDVEGRTTFANRAATKMIGREIEELLGVNQHSLMHHSMADGTPYSEADCPIYAAYKDGKARYRTSEVFWKKDKTSFPVEYSSTPIMERGKIVGAVVTFRDITERKDAEEALRNSEMKFRTVVQSSNDAFILANSRMEIVFWNKGAESSF
jgi:PAS domain S-box-containing protein